MFVEKAQEYQDTKDDAEKQKLEDDAWDAWTTYLFLNGVNKLKFGSLLNHFKVQYALNIDIYPKTLQAAVDALANHKWDLAYHEAK